MDYDVLKAELTIDPLGRNYAIMTDQQAADDLNTEYRDVNYPIDVDQLNAAIRESFKWVSYRERADVQTIEGTYDNPAMREFMDIFMTVSTAAPIDLQSSYMTWLIDSMVSEGSMGPVAAGELKNYGIQTVSRGVELDIGVVKEGDVAFARAM